MNLYSWHKNKDHVKDFVNDTVFLTLKFKEFYKGRSAIGATFVDSEGLEYNMQLEDFENMLQTGFFYQVRSGSGFTLGVAAEFKILKRSSYYYIRKVNHD